MWYKPNVKQMGLVTKERAVGGEQPRELPLTSAWLHLASPQNTFGLFLERTERDFSHFFCKYLPGRVSDKMPPT